jgi:hypothetical protein
MHRLSRQLVALPVRASVTGSRNASSLSRAARGAKVKGVCTRARHGARSGLTKCYSTGAGGVPPCECCIQ